MGSANQWRENPGLRKVFNLGKTLLESLNSISVIYEHQKRVINTMDIDKELVGRNIKSARAEKGMTQSALAKEADISQTQLSDYENGNKLPGLNSIAKIALALGKSIDELCYGDASLSPITTAPDKGRLIVNCVYQLWKNNVLKQHIPTEDEDRYSESFYKGSVADLGDYFWAVERLLKALDDFSEKEYTFNSPELYLEQVLDSVASEIEPNRLKQNSLK